MVAIPLALVLPEKVLPLTLMVTFLFATAFPLDFKVTLTFLALFTFNVALAAVKVVGFLLTVILAVQKDDLYTLLSPAYATVTYLVVALA